MSAGTDFQDWAPMTLRSSTIVKTSQPKRSASSIAAAKIADPDTHCRIKLFTPDSIRTIQKYRLDHNLTQRLLDQQCAFPAGTVNRLESRQAGPTVGQLQKLNSLLKTGLKLE